MSFFAPFLVLWLLALLAGAHLLARRGIALGEDLPAAAAWSVRLAYFAGTGCAALAFLWLATEGLTAP